MSQCVQSLHQLIPILIGLTCCVDDLQKLQKKSYFRDMDNPSSPTRLDFEALLTLSTVPTQTSSRWCNQPCYLHNDAWQLPQDLFTTPSSSRCCNQHGYIHNNPWQLPQHLITTPTSSRCCNQPFYLHSDPWQLPKHLITTLNCFRCSNQPCYLHSVPWKLP